MKNLIIATCFSLVMFSCADDISNTNSNQVLSGSYANMLTIGEYLYLISNTELITYALTDPTQPEEISRTELGFGVESLFIRNNLLFIGSSTTMYIYEAGSDGIPVELNTTDYNSFGTCTRDPIVANDSISYVTLSSTVSFGCDRFELNELRLYDIVNISNPIQVNVLPMEQPKGLGLDDNWLFVCEANDGLKVIDVSDPLDLKEVHHFPGFKAFDVIPNNGLLMVVGPDSLYQFDYSNMDEMYELSTFEL